MEHTFDWSALNREHLRPMFRFNPCQAQITRHTPAFARGKYLLYLIQPPDDKRKSNAYQHIGTVTFSAVADRDKSVAICVQYLRLAEVKFGVTITRVMFRSKEVTFVP